MQGPVPGSFFPRCRAEAVRAVWAAGGAGTAPCRERSAARTGAEQKQELNPRLARVAVACRAARQASAGCRVGPRLLRLSHSRVCWRRALVAQECCCPGSAPPCSHPWALLHSSLSQCFGQVIRNDMLSSWLCGLFLYLSYLPRTALKLSGLLVSCWLSQPTLALSWHTAVGRGCRGARGWLRHCVVLPLTC